MINIVAIDDDLEFLHSIEDQIKKYQDEMKQTLFFSYFTSPMEFLDKFHSQYDLIFLDIDMPGINGFETAKEIRKSDPAVPLIFITNMGSFAIKGYEVHAFDFIMKPLNAFSFQRSLNNAIGLIKSENGHFILIDGINGTKKVDVNLIEYVESVKHYLHFHIENEDVIERGTISEAESQLSKFGFSKCNNGCLVNLKNVSLVKKNEVVVSKNTLLISRSKRKTFLDALTRYTR